MMAGCWSILSSSSRQDHRRRPLRSLVTVHPSQLDSGELHSAEDRDTGESQLKEKPGTIYEASFGEAPSRLNPPLILLTAVRMLMWVQ
jgi:hypothetical protein